LAQGGACPFPSKSGGWDTPGFFFRGVATPWLIHPVQLASEEQSRLASEDFVDDSEPKSETRARAVAPPHTPPPTVLRCAVGARTGMERGIEACMPLRDSDSLGSGRRLADVLLTRAGRSVPGPLRMASEVAQPPRGVAKRSWWTQGRRHAFPRLRAVPRLNAEARRAEAFVAKRLAQRFVAGVRHTSCTEMHYSPRNMAKRDPSPTSVFLCSALPLPFLLSSRPSRGPSRPGRWRPLRPGT
jgi:hypothetical protein